MISGDDFLEDEFPQGDGTAETGTVVVCPHCGETVEITLDPGSGTEQEYMEDCEVCCRPWQVTAWREQGRLRVQVAPLS